MILLCGNKADLAGTKRLVSREMAEAYAKEEGLLWMEASAKSGEGVNEVFEMIGKSGRFLYIFISGLCGFFGLPSLPLLSLLFGPSGV